MKVFGKSNEESYAGKIVRIEIGENSLTNGQSFKFWERILERASDEEAKGIIFDLDTPGGLAFPTEELMTKIANVGIPTVAFVNPNAISAGSFIAVSTDRIYMTPGSKIGSSGIIDGSGREIDPVRRAKLESYFGAQIRYIAKQKGYNPEVIEAMMFLSDEKRVIGDVEVKPGSLLNLNSSEATMMMNDGPLLAQAEVTSLEEVLKAEGWNGDELVTATPTGFERLAWWIAGFSGVLILVGLGGGYLELKTPGFGIGGIICLSAFALFFFGNYMAGNMAGYELAALFVIGIALIGVEIFRDSWVWSGWDHWAASACWGSCTFDVRWSNLADLSVGRVRGGEPRGRPSKAGNESGDWGFRLTISSVSHDEVSPEAKFYR